MISVIIITCNREDALGQCLKSLESQIETGFEVIVVNTSPSPLSPGVTGIVSPLSIEFEHFPTARNVAEARNFAIERAGGEIVAFIDDDCMASPEWIGRIETSLTHADAAGGIVLPKDNHIFPRWWDERLNWIIGLSPPELAGKHGGSVVYPQTANMAVRRDVFTKVTFPRNEKKDGLWRYTEREDPYLWRHIRLSGFRTCIDPHMLVYHDIPASRCRIGNLARRAFADGYIYYRHERLDEYVKWAWRDIVSALPGSIADIFKGRKKILGAFIYRAVFALRQAGYIYSSMTTPPGRLLKFLKSLMAGCGQLFSYLFDMGKAFFRAIFISLYRAFRFRRTLPRNPASILFVALGYVGDMVILQPALRMIRERFPNAHIELLCARGELFRESGLVDHISVLPKTAKSLQVFSFIRDVIKTASPDVTIVAYHHFASPFPTCWYSHYAIGFDRDMGFSSRLLYDMLDERIEKPLTENEVDEIANLVRRITGDSGPFKKYALEIPHEARRKAERLLSESNPGSRDLILLHPRGFDDYKNWGIENWRRLAALFSEIESVDTAFIGGDDIRDTVEAFIRHDSISSRNLCGNTLWEMAALIEKAACLITVDSGPLHLAYALGVPTIALFGGSDERRWGARWDTDRHIAVRSCQFDLTPEELIGKHEAYQMSLLKPEEIFDLWKMFRKKGYRKNSDD